MGNVIQIKRGVGTPPAGALAPYELGFVPFYKDEVNSSGNSVRNWDVNAGYLYIGQPCKQGGVDTIQNIPVCVEYATTTTTATNATSANKLSTAREIITNLSSTTPASFNGTAKAAPGVTGTLSVTNGGTGANSLASGEVLIGNGKETVTTKAITNNINISDAGWTSSSENGTNLITLNTLAYWDGRFNSNSSNLAYCKKGVFGSIVTKNDTDYLSVNGGTISCANANSANWLLVLHQQNNKQSDGWGAGIKFLNASDSESKWAGIISKSPYGSYFNANALYFYTNATEQFSMIDDKFTAPKLVTTAYGTSDPSGTGSYGQLYFKVVS